MAFILSSLANLFKSTKKRHNTDVGTAKLSGPLTRDEFMSVYESMPEAARVKLFSSLTYEQKARLMDLLSPRKGGVPSPATAAEPVWEAEDYLPEKDERKIARLRHVKEVRELKELYAGFEKYPAAAVAEILSGESKNVAATVLLQLSHKFASQVIKSLPELSRGEIVRAMAGERHIVSEALVALGKKISALLAALPAEAPQKIDGVKHVNEILKLMGVAEADRITREVSEFDDVLASKLEQSRYTFEDLIDLNARDFRTLFSSIPDEALWARALKAFDQGKRKSLLGKLPVKRAGVIVSAMAEIQTTRLDSIDKARNKILTQALKLAAQHEISFAGNGLH